MRFSSFLHVPRILMCRPTFFNVKYSINPWMNASIKPDVNRAMDQWETLREKIEKAGAEVQVMEPDEGEEYPDLVFTANAAVVHRQKAYIATFKFKERQGESKLYRRWFEANGYECSENPDHDFEGAGDALFAKSGLLMCGVGPRSCASALPHLAQTLSYPDAPIKAFACHIINRKFFHIDTTFCPLSDGVAIWFPGAFDSVTRNNMSNELKLIDVSEAEANNMACNAVVIDKTVILNKGNPEITKKLQELGYRVDPTDMSEFIKSGGSAKCCTLRLQ